MFRSASAANTKESASSMATCVVQTSAPNFVGVFQICPYWNPYANARYANA